MGVLGLSFYIWLDSDRLLNSYSLMGIASFVFIFPLILGLIINERKT